MSDRTAPPGTAEVRAYWNHRIHDLDISSHQPGTPAGNLPHASPSVRRFARELGSIGEQQIENSLGVGLHVAREAAEELHHRRARLLLRVLEEDRVAVLAVAADRGHQCVCTGRRERPRRHADEREHFPRGRRELAALLWPEHESRLALANLRKALHRLVHEGWLTTVPNRGTFVPSLTVEEMREIYDVVRRACDACIAAISG